MIRTTIKISRLTVRGANAARVSLLLLLLSIFTLSIGNNASAQLPGDFIGALNKVNELKEVLDAAEDLQDALDAIEDIQATIDAVSDVISGVCLGPIHGYCGEQEVEDDATETWSGGWGTRGKLCREHTRTRNHFSEEMRKHQLWVMGDGRDVDEGDDFFHEYVFAGLLRMSNQLSAVMMQQMQVLGAIFDAKHQLEVQRLFETQSAKAIKRFHPSEEICSMGSIARKLASSERSGEFNAIFLTQYSQDRQLGHKHAAGSTGIKEARETRLAIFKARYCDKHDNNNTMMLMCGNGPVPPTVNRDIDYIRTIDNARTLNVDFTDEDRTGDEMDVLALTRNLFAHNIFDRPIYDVLDHPDGQQAYIDLRSIVAKRSVAENSIYSIIGMKSSGSGDSLAGNDNYVAAVLQDFGVPRQEAIRMVGENPSYYAQMEMLAKKLYQRPEFYTNLYGKPANTRRKDVAMQAIGLMLSRDIYRSDLRSEALLSLLLEMELMEFDTDIENRRSLLKDYGREVE
jgi:hypothetical protein